MGRSSLPLTERAEALEMMEPNEPPYVAARTEAEIHERELAKIFARLWMPVGRAEELADIGGYFTWDRTRIPTVMVRSVDGQIRGYYNSCRHRGAPVVRTPTGKARAFRCQYHSWTYDTFGKLMAIPDERDFGNIDRCAHSLVPLRLAELGGWLWIDQSDTAPELAEVLGPLLPRLEGQAAGRFAGRRTRLVDANWKTVVAHLAVATPASASLFPNICFAGEGANAEMFAAWPRDEGVTEVELVACRPEGVEAPSDELLDQRLSAALAGLSTSAAPSAAPDFAAQWSRAMSAAS